MILRIVNVFIRSSTKIEVYFTNNLDSGISVDNVIIEVPNYTLSSLEITSVVLSNKVMTITTRPMVSGGYYKLIFSSTDNQDFIGTKGEKLIEDGKNNVHYFVGLNENNEIKNRILDNLPDIYTTESGSLINDVIGAGAEELLKLANSIQEIKSENYVSVEVVDEEMVRGSGPSDRLLNEGAFQLIRVGSSKTNSTESDSIIFSEFPTSVVSLQQIEVTETVSNSSDQGNSFSGLIISLANKPVIKVLSVVLIQDGISYEYNIEQYKYGLLESKYDTDYSFSYSSLQNNQILLNNSAIGVFPYPQGSDTIVVEYLYKKEGRDIGNVEIYTIVDKVRENVDAVATSFFLDNAPIVNSLGNIPTSGGVVWLDPAQNYGSNLKHPAFITEIVFTQSSLPKSPGEFSINYTTGQVFVFGVNGSGTDGTTIVPPVATYKFKKNYVDGLDYTFYSDLDEVVSIPDRDLRGNPGTIVFSYEDTFANGTDFIFNSHTEELNERVENRLIEGIGLRTKNYPINQVFRIYNETTGEIYTTTRVVDNEVYFTSVNPPRIKNVVRESVDFENIIQSQLVIVETIAVVGKPFDVLKINLEDNDIVSQKGGFIGSSFNTSLVFSDGGVFSREIYYNTDNTLESNLLRLNSAGDYVVDYESGIVYLATSGISSEIGDASYKRGKVKTNNSKIIRADNIYRSYSVSEDNVETFEIGEVDVSTISISNLSLVGEKEIDGDVIVVDGGKVEVSENVFRLNGIYQVTDLQTTYSPINFGAGAVTVSTNSSQLSLVPVEINDTNDGIGIPILYAGSRRYIEASRISNLFNEGLVELDSVVSVSSLGGSENLYLQGMDGYVDASENRIYLPTSVSYSGVVKATYTASLRDAAAVLVDYVSGDMFVDYAYCQDELLVSYEYGDNILDWSKSSALSVGETYYASYKYGALRNSLRDNFGVLTSIPDLSTIPDLLDRETYRNAISGTLQAFVKGPTIPSIENLVKSFTKINPEITESVFLEWILGRDNLSLNPMKLTESFVGNLPTFADGKFGKGLFLSESGQSAVIPATSNIRFEEGTWESFVIPNWDGLGNDASLVFDLLFDGDRNSQKVFIGSGATNPSEIPFTLTKDDLSVWGVPYNLHGVGVSGYFVWYDSTSKKWRVRMRSPILEERGFTGKITTSGQFYEALVATTADGYDGYDTQFINELNDKLWTTDETIKFDFIVDGYDLLNIDFDAYDSYDVGVYAGFDGIDFSSDNFHYFYDTGFSSNKNRMSLFKDGKGFLKFRVFDKDGRKREISENISNWLSGETHHLATSWRINSIEQNDELHLFIDGEEVSNKYRFNGYLSQTSGNFLDSAFETLLNSASFNTIGAKDLSTVSGSNIVSSLLDFSSISVGDQFIITDNTADGEITLLSPYVYVRNIIGLNQLELETGDGYDFNLSLTLNNVGFSINPLTLKTSTDPNFEKMRVFSKDTSEVETELNSPSSILPEYEFLSDGYNDYVKIYNGVNVGDDVLLKTYGLNLGRCVQNVYVWGDNLKNTLNAVLPQPTNVSKINITGLIIRNTKIEEGLFALISTIVGGHLVNLLVSSLDFCQVSNVITGRKISVNIRGDNFYWAGVNQVMFIGETTDSVYTETLTFTDVGTQTTTKHFTRLDDVVVTFTPINSLRPAGSIEIRETYPINWSDNDGYCATIRLSVVEQSGFNGVITSGSATFSDGYSRFGAEDVGKSIQIVSPTSIAGVYLVDDVNLDSSMTVMDSNTITLNTTFADGYSNIYWKLLNTSFADSGFSNGLITLENEIGEPFLLKGCWFEIDMPTKLYIPWDYIPEDLFVGSDIFSLNQANSVIDEMRILNELSTDSALGQVVSSSERTVTTDYLKVSEFETNDQTLGLFHFNDDVVNSAKFNLNYSSTYTQSENSVNSNFGQSGVFTSNIPTKFDNTSIFRNNQGTIEFWVSPLLDTYNDPKKRYYVDMSTELVVETTPTTLITVVLSFRVSSISSIKISGGDDTNYFIGGLLDNDGVTITLGQPLPSANVSILITYVPLISQGDRFSIYKSENQQIVLAVRASDVDYTIHAPVYWKKGTWHRIFVGWDLNNSDNQDRLILMVDGLEAGTIRYGTGLVYGTGGSFGQQTVWGGAEAGTTASRNILSDINLLDTFNEINIGSDFSGAYSAYAKFDNMRFSSDLRSIVYLGGTGPGQLIGRDVLYTSNLNSALPVTTDALTRLLLDFNSDPELVENIITIRDASSGIFDFYVKVIDSFSLIDTDLAKKIVTSLINQLKPAHTRAFVSFIK
jgi:hypothetical protein